MKFNAHITINKSINTQKMKNLFLLSLFICLTISLSAQRMAVVPSAFAENELSYVNPYKYGAIVKELGTFRTFYFNKYRRVAGNYHFIIKMNNGKRHVIVKPESSVIFIKEIKM